MEKVKKIIVIVMLVCPVVICAQQISIHSPTAANLGLYGEIPVSCYTGTPNISIPLYEIRGKTISVPIELSYHPAGIRPEIHPGPVGLGWSLRAGGVISRTVRGSGPDESDSKNRLGIVMGYLNYTGGWMAQNNWKDYFKNAITNDCTNCRYYVRGSMALTDIEPDEFSFSVLGISGKFYFDHTGQIQVQCDNPVKVTFNNEFVQPHDNGIKLDYSNSWMHRAFKSFTIIDEHGTQYSFGGAGAIEFSDPVSYGRDNNGYGIPATGELLQATSWFLTQIKSADGADIINFEYERGPFICQLYRAFNYYSYAGNGGSGWGYNTIAVDGTLISPVYLKRITGSNGVEISLAYTPSNDLKYSWNSYNSLFSYTTDMDNYRLLEQTGAIPRFQPFAPSNKYDRIQWLKLDTIYVKGTMNASIRQINFGYNNNSSERLFLDSLKVYGENGLTPPMNYTFSYKNKNRLPSSYLTCITDHWGFNNGKTYPSNGFSASNKTPDAYYTDSGVLSGIQYPTGGTAHFEYELHDYAKVVNTKNRSNITSQSGTASGLRINKIITDNLTGNTVTRAFFYKETPTSSVSSGILNMLPQYSYSINGNDCDNKSFSVSLTRSMPVIPLTKDNEGLYIGYTYVCEQVSGGGYTQYHYTNHDNGHSDTLLTNGKWHRDIFPSDPHCSRYFERGRLKKETSYNTEGQAIAVNETVWDRYGSLKEDNPRALFFEGFMVGYDYCSTVAYLHYCYKFLPSQKTETVYDLNGQNPMTTQADYCYNSHNLLSSHSVFRSDGKMQTTKWVYPFEITGSPYIKMTEKHILSDYAGKISYMDNKVISAEARIYNAVGINNSIYKPTQIKILPLNSSITESQLYPAKTQNVSLYISFNSYPNEASEYDYEDFTIFDFATVQMEVSIGERFVDLYTTSSFYTIDIIKNGGSNESVYTKELSAVGDGRQSTPGDYVYSDFLYAYLSPGSYRIELKHRADIEYDPKDGLPEGIYYDAQINGYINEKYNISSTPELKPEIHYRYDDYGNVRESKQEGSQVATTYLWGYNYRYPIAEIKNASYDRIKNILGTALIDRIAGAVIPSDEDMQSIHNLRSNTGLSNALVTVYKYKPLAGMTSKTDPNGFTTYYDYDAFGRLKESYFYENGVKKMLETYDYHYKDQ